MRTENREQRTEKNNKGFTLLFAILVSILVLAVGASIISIALKQVILSGSARESQLAFYSSNTGIECAVYWDLHKSSNNKIVFATSSESDWENQAGIVTCADYDILTDSNGLDACDSSIDEDDGYCIDFSSSGGDIITKTKFRFDFTNIDSNIEYCGDVIVTKTTPLSGPVRTTVESRGYNTCNESNPRRIERGLRFTY